MKGVTHTNAQHQKTEGHTEPPDNDHGAQPVQQTLSGTDAPATEVAATVFLKPIIFRTKTKILSL